MFKRVSRGLHYTAILLLACLSPSRLGLIRRMIAFSQSLPGRFNQPLPAMMAQLTPELQAEGTASVWNSDHLSEAEICRLADAVAAWHLFSPLGICLRRSLLRYYFLREAGLPLKIIFGARLKSRQEGGGLGGHAWLTLHDLPYYENPGDYEGFVEIYRYPEEKNGRAEDGRRKSGR